MDCSGFIHYVLTQNGMKDAPRDAREQYVWVRKGGTFPGRAGASRRQLRTGRLENQAIFFFGRALAVDRDPAITHTMIYLGREKDRTSGSWSARATGEHTRASKNLASAFSISKFLRRAEDGRSATPVFVGYARIPEFKNGRCRSREIPPRSRDLHRGVGRCAWLRRRRRKCRIANLDSEAIVPAINATTIAMMTRCSRFR